MRRLLWSIFTVVVLAGCQSLPTAVPGEVGSGGEKKAVSPNPTDYRGLNDSGVSALRLGKYDEAQVHFQMALALQPEYARTHFNLALVYYRKGETDREIAEYREAIRIDPNYFNAHLNLAHAYLAAGKVGEAETEYRWVLKKDPKHRKALYNLAVILTDRKKTVEAKGLFERYLKLEPKGPWAEKARKYLKGGTEGGKP
ncbi:MAG: tetratricopeptide repeat protein [Nitrospirae bacterium]|nr:tetratricopeptide repeat protein [Nitrospirota bacterium]